MVYSQFALKHSLLDTQITHGLQLFVHRNTHGFYLINLQIAVTQRA